MANKTTTEQMATPPFPEKMSFREMYDGLFNRDFLSEQEFKTICDTAEMYANGCIRECKSHPSASVEDAAKEMAEAIEQTFKQANGEDEKEYKVSFLYPLNNKAFQLLVSSLRNYKKIISDQSWQASQQTPAPRWEEQEELINWLDKECPNGTQTADLSHDFAESLRARINKIKKCSNA